MAPATPVVFGPPEGQVWWLNTPGAFGTAEPDIEVWGYCDGDAPTLASRVPDDPGWGWSNPAPLADGPHTFTAFARNEHGDSPSVTVNFSVDTIAPVAPVITNYPTELVFGEGFTFSGTGEPGSWVTAWGINDGYDVEVAGDGTWSVDIPDSEWPQEWDPEYWEGHRLQARAYDEAGHYSASTYVSVTVVSSEPGGPEEPEEPEPTTRVYLRHPTRHLQQALEDRVKAVLQGCGWFDAPPLATSPVKFYGRRIMPVERTRVEGNLVAVSFGDTMPDQDVELGGGMIRRTFVFWIDVVGAAQAVTISIVDDIRDSLAGVTGSQRLELYDYATDPRLPLLGWEALIDAVQQHKPDGMESDKLWLSLGGLLVIAMPADGKYSAPEVP